MTRSSLWILSLLMLALTTSASTPLNVRKALERQRLLVAEYPNDSGVYNDLGNLLSLAGQENAAEEAYRKAIELDPESQGARFNLALMLQQNGDTGRALREYRQLLKVDRQHAWAHYQSGVIYESRHDRQQAIESYARAFALDPNLAFVGYNPHIIENQLATEALLRSRRYRQTSTANVPRHYDDPERIASLMLDLEPPAPAVLANPERVARAQRLPAPGADEDGDDPEAAADGTTAAEQDGQVAEAAATPTAVASSPSTTPTDPASRSRIVTPGSRTPSEAASLRSQPNAQPNGLNAPGTVGGVLIQADPRFRPSPLSTGRLELKLLPAPSAPSTTAG